MTVSNYTRALRRHLFRAKLTAYSLVLGVGVVQIIVRERFPALKPPWRIIGGGLIVVALSVIFVPPLWSAARGGDDPPAVDE
jgi:hypothetical protein